MPETQAAKRERTTNPADLTNMGHTVRAKDDAQIGAMVTRVCVSIAEMGRLLPAKTARSLSAEFRRVVAFGRISVIDDIPTGTAAMQLLIDTYFPRLKPDHDYRAIQPR